jgi:hypothetical protein
MAQQLELAAPHVTAATTCSRQECAPSVPLLSNHRIQEVFGHTLMQADKDVDLGAE